MKREKAMTTGDVYRAAAKLIEERRELFPCIAVGRCTPGGEAHDWHRHDTLAGAFILAMSPLNEGFYTRNASDAYLDQVGESQLGEHSILALCFAAAIADAGGL